MRFWTRNRKLTKLLRRVDPLQGRPEAQPDTALMERILSEQPLPASVDSGHTEPTRAARPRSRWITAGIGLAMAAVLALVVSTATWTPEAKAYSPPPLEVTPIHLHTDEVIEQALAKLRTSDGPGQPMRESNSIGWYLQLDIKDNDLGDESSASGSLSTQVRRLRWHEDGTGRERVTRGQPLSSGPGQSVVPDDGKQVGEVILNEKYRPGQFESVAPGMSSENPRVVMEQVKNSYQEEGRGPLQMMLNVESVLDEWVLTGTQTKILLEYFASAPGVRVLGNTIDREGRPAVGIYVENEKSRIILLLSRATGRIIGIEEVTRRALGNVPEGSVVEYTEWTGKYDL